MSTDRTAITAASVRVERARKTFCDALCVRVDMATPLGKVEVWAIREAMAKALAAADEETDVSTDREQIAREGLHKKNGQNPPPGDYRPSPPQSFKALTWKTAPKPPPMRVLTGWCISWEREVSREVLERFDRLRGRLRSRPWWRGLNKRWK